MWLEYITQALGILAGVVVLHYALGAIDAMNAGTQHGVRLAFILMAAGGFAQIIDPWIARESASFADLLITGGLALLLVSDRRCTMCPRAAVVRDGRRRRDTPPPISGATT